jgi:hypothetical protein
VGGDREDGHGGRLNAVDDKVTALLEPVREEDGRVVEFHIGVKGHKVAGVAAILRERMRA